MDHQGHLSVDAVASTALTHSAPISVRLGASTDNVVRGAVLHEERHRQMLLGTPFGLAQYYLSLAAVDGSPLDSFRGETSVSNYATQLMQRSLLVHEGWALAAEAFELPLHGPCPPPQPVGSDCEALELYSTIAGMIPRGWEACTMPLMRAVGDVCLEATLTEDDLVVGLTEQTVQRLLSETTEHPDARLVHFVTECERISPLEELARVLHEALTEALPNEDLGVPAKMNLIAGMYTGQTEDTGIHEAVDTAFSWRLEKFVRHILRGFAPGIPERNPTVLERFALATSESWSSQGIMAKPVTLAPMNMSDLKWHDLLSRYSIEYLVPSPVKSVYLDYPSSVADEASAHFAGVVSGFEGMRFIVWASVDFVCVIPVVEGEVSDTSDLDTLKRIGVHNLIQAKKTTGLHPILRVFAPALINVESLVEILGDSCLGVVTVDEMNDEGHDWSLGGHLSHTLKTPVAVLARANHYLLSSSLLEMYRKRGVTAIRQVLWSDQRHYFATIHYGVQVVFELPSALLGLAQSFNPELYSWMQECLQEGRKSYSLTHVNIECEGNLSLLLMSGLLERPQELPSVRP